MPTRDRVADCPVAGSSIDGGGGIGVHSASAAAYFSAAASTSPARTRRCRRRAPPPPARAAPRTPNRLRRPAAAPPPRSPPGWSRAIAACGSVRFALRACASTTHAASDAQSASVKSWRTKPSWSSHSLATKASPRTSVGSPHCPQIADARALSGEPLATPLSSTYRLTPIHQLAAVGGSSCTMSHVWLSAKRSSTSSPSALPFARMSSISFCLPAPLGDRLQAAVVAVELGLELEMFSSSCSGTGSASPASARRCSRGGGRR